MKADEAVLRTLLEHGGEFTWDRNAAMQVPRGGGRPGHVWRRTPAPEASLKRLSIQGYVQVETHNISVWKFGPRDEYKTGQMVPSNIHQNIALLEQMDNPTWRTRVDIRAALTDRGRQHAVALGLLD